MYYLFFILVNLLGAMSPGPDFAIVTRYALKGSRTAALQATLGASTALIIHVSYCLLGAAVFLQNSPTLFIVLQLLGAFYLGYLGIKMLGETTIEKVKLVEVDTKKAFLEGFLTNLLNPKATLFILSMLAQVVSFETSILIKTLYGITIPLVAFTWFAFLSVTLTHPKVYKSIQYYQVAFVRIMGTLLVGLCLWVIFQATSTVFC